jgi:high-affinity Fe2+/Pb2+ permease
MSEPRQKDALDIAIDFFFGAAFADVVIALAFLRASGRGINLHWEWQTFWICLLAATLIAGSLAALYRNDFWSNYQTYSVIPPMEESVSKRSRILLWMLFAIGCASLGLLLIR